MTRARGCVAALAFVGFAAALACGSGRSHVYAGRLYREARDCVDTTTSIDVVDGPEPGVCAPTCLLGPAATASAPRPVYVSTMCAPYPPLFDSSQTAAVCAAALAAASRGDTCTGDAGSSNPRDASSDAPPE